MCFASMDLGTEAYASLMNSFQCHRQVEERYLMRGVHVTGVQEGIAWQEAVHMSSRYCRTPLYA